MARKMTEWPSKRGPITKIMPSDGCIGDTVPLAVGKWYDFHEFGWYMGNVGTDVSVLRRIRAMPLPAYMRHIPSGSLPFSNDARFRCLDTPAFPETDWTKSVTQTHVRGREDHRSPGHDTGLVAAKTRLSQG